MHCSLCFWFAGHIILWRYVNVLKVLPPACSAASYAYGRVCLCVSVCPVRADNVKNIDLETSFFGIYLFIYVFINPHQKTQFIKYILHIITF